MSGDDGIRVSASPLLGMSFAEILPGQLFLGPAAVHGKEPERLQAVGVTHVLNLTIGEPCRTEFFTCKQVQVDDDASENLRSHFDDCVSFVNDAILGGGVVYVHCVSGVSRSSTLVIAFLMKHRDMSLRQAFDYVRERRNCISPNVGFFDQLCAFEKDLHAARGGSGASYQASFPPVNYHMFCLKNIFPDLQTETIRAVLASCNFNLLQAETQLLNMVVSGEL